MKLKTKCAIHKGALECQLAAMPHSTVCWFHMNNSVLFPHDLGECVVPRIDLTQFKALLLERQGNVCAICGYRFYGDVGIDVDHLWPRDAGGKNVLANLGAVHSTCNRVAKSIRRLHDPEIRERLKEITKHWTREESATMQALSDDEEAEVCRRYLEGESTVKLGKAFGVDANTISSILKRNGVKTRSYSEARGITPEVEEEVCRRYLEGETYAELAEAFDVGAGTIGRIFKRNGVKTRSIKEAKDGLTDKQEKEICRRYKAGENTYELAEAFGVGGSTIGRIFKRNKVKARSNSEAQKLYYEENEVHNKTDKKTEQEICRRYKAGEGSGELAEAFGVSTVCICRIIKRNGIEARSNKEAHGGLTDEQEQEVCRRYKAGENSVELGRAFGVSTVCICRILKRNKVKTRSNKIAQGGLTDEQEKEVCRRYKAGESPTELGEAFGVANPTIFGVLKRNGVKTRSISEAKKLAHQRKLRKSK